MEIFLIIWSAFIGARRWDHDSYASRKNISTYKISYGQDARSWLEVEVENETALMVIELFIKWTTSDDDDA